MDGQKKKGKLFGLALLGLGIVLFILAIVFIFTKEELTNTTVDKEPVDVYEATMKDEPVYLDLQYMTESVAYLEAVASMQYYITFDSEWYPAVLCIYDSDLPTYQPYIDWLFSAEEENGPKEIRVTGYSVPYDEELIEFVIEYYNDLWGDEYLTKENFTEAFGEYYLSMGPSGKNFGRFNNGIYCLIGAVICLAIGILCSYKAPRKQEDEVISLEVKNPERKAMGILGAMIGAVLGGILWAAVGALGYISTWIGIVIIIFANTGYRMFAGKESTFGKLISCLLSFIVVLPATYVAGAWDYYKAINEAVPEYITLGKAMQEFPNYLTMADEWGRMISNVVVGCVFMLIVSLHNITKTSAKKKEDAKIAERAKADVDD